MLVFPLTASTYITAQYTSSQAWWELKRSSLTGSFHALAHSSQTQAQKEEEGTPKCHMFHTQY